MDDVRLRKRRSVITSEFMHSKLGANKMQDDGTLGHGGHNEDLLGEMIGAKLAQGLGCFYRAPAG